MFPPDIIAKFTRLDAAALIKGTVNRGNDYTLGYVKPIFSRAFLQQHGLSYDPELRIGEDYQLLLEALLSGAHCCVEPTAGYRYTARKHSISYRLTMADVTRMMQADERLLTRYTLDSQAAKAQSRRTEMLKKKYAFNRMVEAVKQKDWYQALKAVASYPACLWFLWWPIRVRIKRLLADSHG